MEHITAIQEIVDENKESMPSGAAVGIMRECQKMYKDTPKLWQVHYYEMRPDSKNWVTVTQGVLLVEEDSSFPEFINSSTYWHHVFTKATISPPDRHPDGRHVRKGNLVYVITKVEPYKKRARDVSEVA